MRGAHVRVAGDAPQARHVILHRQLPVPKCLVAIAENENFIKKESESDTMQNRLLNNFLDPLNGLIPNFLAEDLNWIYCSTLHSR